MKKIFLGIIALIIPLVMIAQATKESQEIEQLRLKVLKVEKENSRLRQQLNTLQKSVTTLNESETKERMDVLKQDSIAGAAQDTVRSYSGRLLKMEQNIAGTENTLKLRCIGMIVFVILLVLVLAIRWWTHIKTHRKEMEDLFSKLNSEREENELRVAEIKGILDQSGNEMSALKKETGERLNLLSDNIARADNSLQVLLNEKTNNLEQKLKDGLAGFKKETDEGNKELLKKIENMQALLTSVTSKISELGQKVSEFGKKG
jgi:t-SNARE complex subunit (syntaxin)